MTNSGIATNSASAFDEFASRRIRAQKIRCNPISNSVSWSKGTYIYVEPSFRAPTAAIRPPRRKPWRFDVQDAEGPIDVDAFLRRLVDVLLDVGREADADSSK